MSLVNDTITVEALVQSLTEYVDARREHDKAFDEFTGYSWGYHGRSLVQAYEDAAKEFQDRLSAFIDQRVEQRIGQLIEDI